MNAKQELLLIKAAQNGDRDALSKLWDELTPKLFGYLINVMKNRSVAEDLLQTTWLKALSALPGFRPRGSGIGPWLFAIARNECRQYWRKEKHETELFDSDTNVQSTDNSETHNKLLVEQALGKLGEDDRELLRLRYIADLPLTDIAGILNINSIAVRVRLHRAIGRARTILQ